MRVFRRLFPPLFLTLSLLLLLPALARAQAAIVMEALVLPFTVAEGATEVHQAWAALEEMKGVNWRGHGPYEILFRNADGDNYRDGTLRLRGHGNADFMVSGDPYKEGGGMQALEVTLLEANAARVFEPEDFGKIMRAQFPRARLKLVQQCGNRQWSGSDTYEVVYPGRKPVVVHISTDSGGNAPKTRGSAIEVTRRVMARWSAGCQ